MIRPLLQKKIREENETGKGTKMRQVEEDHKEKRKEGRKRKKEGSREKKEGRKEGRKEKK